MSSDDGAVKAAGDPCKQVILVIQFGVYNTLENFTVFVNNKNYDEFEITRYYFCLEFFRRLADWLGMCE